MKRIAVVLGSMIFVFPVAPVLADTLWDHNGSVMSLDVDGDKRTFSYKEPRPGMVKAGAQPGSLVFEGKSVGGRYVGRAYFYNQACGRYPYQVEGPVLNDGSKVLLKGDVPRLNRRCKIKGTRTDTLVFELIEPSQQMPPQFLGAWGEIPVAGDSIGDLPRVCKKSEFRSSNSSVFLITKNAMEALESGCNFVSVKKTYDATEIPESISQAITVVTEGKCSGEGQTWDSKAIWHLEKVDGKLLLFNSGFSSNATDDVGKPVDDGEGAFASVSIKCSEGE